MQRHWISDVASSPKKPKRAGVIGSPIGHSLSPVIHHEWARREKASAYYIPLETNGTEAAFVKAVEAAKTLGFSGLNVTLPHKEHALQYSDHKSDQAKSIGAANMLTFEQDGVYADNSDITGFVDSCDPHLPSRGERKKAAVLGAGGAARGVLLALQTLGFNQIIIANRTLEKAQNLAQAFDGKIDATHWNNCINSLIDVDFLVNTTSLGMIGQPALELDIQTLPAGAVVSDIVYTPLETDLLKRAKTQGLKVIDGLSMLMHQAVPGYLAWLGQEAVVDVALRSQLEAILKKDNGQ